MPLVWGWGAGPWVDRRKGIGIGVGAHGAVAVWAPGTLGPKATWYVRTTWYGMVRVRTHPLSLLPTSLAPPGEE